MLVIVVSSTYFMNEIFEDLITNFSTYNTEDQHLSDRDTI